MNSPKPSDMLRTEFRSLPLVEVLQKPPSVLLGVSTEAQAVLLTLGVASVFDLALARIFESADQINDAAENPANPLNRFGAPARDMVRPGLPGTLRMPDYRFQPVDILSGVGDAARLQSALGVHTVRDLALYPPYRAARRLLDQVFFPERLQGFDPEAPADLVPKTGEFPTERVQYTVLLLDEIRRAESAPPLIDVASATFTPVDVSAVSSTSFGFNTLGLGALLTLNQSWYMQGVTLGHLLHSMALAPGESTRIAVVDWSRKTTAGQTEQVSETEALTQDTSRNRTISEVTEAVATESQSGFSHTDSRSTTKEAGVSGGAFGFGVNASIAKTTASADSYSTTAGSRQVGASTLQQAADRTHQNAHAARTRRASVVREVSQSEHEQVSTRVITNYNHMHALTVQYYEVLQAYRVETAVARCDRVVFVPFKLIEFSGDNLLRRFRGALIDAALTRVVRDTLVNFDTLELKPDPSVHFPVLGTSIREAIRLSTVVRPTRITTSSSGTTTVLSGTTPAADGSGGAEVTTTVPLSALVKPAVSPSAVKGDVARTLWATELRRLASTLGDLQLKRDSESLFLPSDVKIVDAEVRAVPGQTLTASFLRRDGTRVSDPLVTALALADVARIVVTGSSPSADIDAGVVLTLSRNGILFPLELPAVRVVKASAETRVADVNAAGADVNLVQHLNDNRLHYSQAVFRTLDAAQIAGLLSAYSVKLNGQLVPLVQAAEPKPLRIVGNYLAFKINTDPVGDVEWRTFMSSRGIAIGQAKVDVVPLSSGGVFAEAVLGRFNCAEKLDITRFWNWQDSPIPMQASDIAAIQTGTRASTENLTPGALSAPIVNITQPTALPDPSGLSAALNSVQNGAMFRDMSGLASTIALAQSAITASAAGATAAGSQATQAMKAKLDAEVNLKKIAADLEAAKAGKPLANQSPSTMGATINEEKKQAEDAKEAARTKATGLGQLGTAAAQEGAIGAVSGTAVPGSTALSRIIGNDESLRSFQGLDPLSPEPALAATAEGVPLLEWDFHGVGYGLLYKDNPDAVADFPSEQQLEEIVRSGAWEPTNDSDFKGALLGSRSMAGASFDDLLFALALLPVGSMKTLNVVSHAANMVELAFGALEFTFIKSLGETRSDLPEEGGILPRQRLKLSEVLALMGDGPVQTGKGPVKLNDVRKAFAVDAEVRVFNLTNPLDPEYLQALANLFQVRVSGFVNRPVRVTAEVIATAEEGSVRILSRKIDIGYFGEPLAQPVNFFVNLLERGHPARGSLYTAFPRRT